MEKIILPKNVESIINMLASNGFEAYAVGGCVRDSLMGITPHGWEICTSARYEDICRLHNWYGVIPTKIECGTVTVLLGDTGYEVTTFRSKTGDTGTLREDLLLRDFTVNAMAYNHDVGLVDYFGGREDIKNKLIRCVGNPEDRYAEDPLRILRAIRFAISLNFALEKEARKHGKAMSGNLSNVDGERVASEIMKTVREDLCEKESLIVQFIDVISEVIPELKQKDINRVAKLLAESIPIVELRLCILFDFGESEIKAISKRLKLQKDLEVMILDAARVSKSAVDMISIIHTLQCNKSDKTDVYNILINYCAEKLLSDVGYDSSIIGLEFLLSVVGNDRAKQRMILDLEMAVGEIQFAHKILVQ